MSKSMNLLDNSIFLTVKPNDHEGSPAIPFGKIEFHLARKPFTNGGADGSFQLERLNPTTTSSNNAHIDQRRVVHDPVIDGSSSNNRDAPDLDPENSFRITFRRIGAGLENLGNTCFLNSVLQCLTYTEPLAAYLQSGKHQITCRNAGFCALCAIQQHVSRALQSSGKSLAPKDLVSNLRYISRNFRSSRQEDAHEYMVNLLESMHKCCLPSAYEGSLVHDIFGGRLRSQVKCMQCNYCSNKFDSFLDLSLEISKADTLYKAFADFTAKEQLDGGAKQYNCQNCNQKVKALKQLTIHDAPNVLMIHLKRFRSDISGQKIDKIVHFAPTLDLKPFVTGQYDGELKYTLYGVLVHLGWSMHSGHYYCFVRTSSGMWYSLDDNQVIQVSERTVFEQKAYMLFYFRDRKNIPSKKPIDIVHKKETVIDSMRQNNTSVLHESTKSYISIRKGHDIDDVAKTRTTSFDNVAILPSTSDGPQNFVPIIDKKEELSTRLQEREDKKSTSEDLSESTSVREDIALGEASLLKMETLSIDTKAVNRKGHKKIKNCLKINVMSMKLCTNILVGASLNQRKKKKKKNKRKSGLKINAKNNDIILNRVERNSNGMEVREPESSKDFTSRGCKTELVHLLTADYEDRILPRWEEDESTPSEIKETHEVQSIGYIGDEWDEEYDKGKKKRARSDSCKEFDGRNRFQDIANERLKLHAGKRKRLSKKQLKQYKKSSSGYRPFRI